MSIVFRQLQLNLQNKVDLQNEIFALYILLNDQITKWYNGVLVGNSNRKIQSRIQTVQNVAQAIEFQEKDKIKLTNKYFWNHYANSIWFETLGLRYILNLRMFLIHSSPFVIPLFLFFKFENRIFDLLIGIGFAVMYMYYYRKIKLYHYKETINEIFQKSKRNLLQKTALKNG